jgi:hypothetical protein
MRRQKNDHNLNPSHKKESLFERRDIPFSRQYELPLPKQIDLPLPLSEVAVRQHYNRVASDLNRWNWYHDLLTLNTITDLVPL